MIKVAAAMLAILVMMGNAQAKTTPLAEPIVCGNYLHLCAAQWKFETKKVKPFRADPRRVHRKSGHARHAGPAHASHRAAPQRAAQRMEGPGKTLHGVIAPLAEKAEQIMRVCGSWIMSAVRHTQVAGSGRLSCHANGHAVDIAGNSACIYSLLKGWPGGYSTDYARVRCRGVSCPHVHVSLGCREDGKRFVHHGTKARKHRMARS